MSIEVSLDGYPPESYTDLELIKRAGAWAFNQYYGLTYQDTQPLYSAIAGDQIIDILTYTQSPELRLAANQPYPDIVVMAILDLAEKTIRFVGWEYTITVRSQFYGSKRVANRVVDYIHTSRLQHMSLLEDLLDLKKNSSEGI